MTTKAQTWQLLDKRDWPGGPWLNEADARVWVDRDSGYPCLVRRHDVLGHLCGYVGVPPRHPFHEVERDSDAVIRLECHGGVNWTSYRTMMGLDQRIIPALQPWPRHWWLGFDCAHAWDRAPMPGLDNDIYALMRPLWADQTYRRLSQVVTWCGHLARQLKRAEQPTGNKGDRAP